MYVVVDTSVLIAAFLNSRGLSARIVRASPADHFLLCVSQAIVGELVSKLTSRGTPASTMQIFLEAVRTHTVMCDDAEYSTEQIARDDHVIGCYHRCKANLVVTNDKALRRRLKRDDIPAVRPSEFQAYLG